MRGKPRLLVLVCLAAFLGPSAGAQEAARVLASQRSAATASSKARPLPSETS